MIKVVISSGPEKIMIQSVEGMNEDAAKKALIKQGFTSKNITVTSEYSSDVESGKATRTDPAEEQRYLLTLKSHCISVKVKNSRIRCQFRQLWECM